MTDLESRYNPPALKKTLYDEIAAAAMAALLAGRPDLASMPETLAEGVGKIADEMLARRRKFMVELDDCEARLEGREPFSGRDEEESEEEGGVAGAAPTLHEGLLRAWDARLAEQAARRQAEDDLATRNSLRWTGDAQPPLAPVDDLAETCALLEEWAQSMEEERAMRGFFTSFSTLRGQWPRHALESMRDQAMAKGWL